MSAAKLYWRGIASIRAAVSIARAGAAVSSVAATVIDLAPPARLARREDYGRPAWEPQQRGTARLRPHAIIAACISARAGANSPQENAMDEGVRKISADDIDPRYTWARA